MSQSPDLSRSPDPLDPTPTDLDTLLSGENAAYVESLYEDWVLGKDAVPPAWADLFGSLRAPGTMGNGAPPPQEAPTPQGAPSPQQARAPQPAPIPAPVPVPARPTETARPPFAERGLDGGPVLGVFGLVNAYRTYGHLIADLDPLGRSVRVHPFLDPAEFGFQPDRLDTRVRTGFFGSRELEVRELIGLLHETYCRTFAVEFMEMRDKQRRDWLIGEMEPGRNRPAIASEDRLRVLSLLLASQRFEQFLHRRFLGQKRFSLEGGETLIPLLDAMVEVGAELGVEEIVLAMAHRGRLNVMAHTLGMPYRALFSGFQTTLVPLDAQGAGDVKYHRGYSADRFTASGRKVHMSLCANPSHLEAINPIAEGIVRAKQNYRGDAERMRVIPVQIHGDAAFTGQGIVSETLALSELDNYWTGGTIHIVINNQIGFTTDPNDYRFTSHPSDMAKVIQAPVFHVNADDPEACVHAARLAIQFRQHFREDVIIDLVCYRRHGHNEGDDPSYTQPLLYKAIEDHSPVGELYTARLLDESAVEAETVERMESNLSSHLEAELEASTSHTRLEGAEGYHGLWVGFDAGEEEDRSTAVSRGTIQRVGGALTNLPDDFHLHPKLQRLIDGRAKAIEPEGRLDWALGEALALGSLLDEGVTVRMTGQDVERGTFSQRHAVLHDVETGGQYVPLNRLSGGGGKLIIRNTMLSEAAVLGFEYGYSTVDPGHLVIWEAQFGDFANGAQIIIDQFIASAETKWGRSSGLVLLLPHGYEGQGPEHSSARLERFLQLCAEDNMRVCNLTTPAQYFHALRRQIHHAQRKPLVVMTPKSLLRLPVATSAVEELVDGEFSEVIDDPRRASGDLDPGAARRVLICSGKVYYTLAEAREEGGFDDVALLRLEQLHPFPFEDLREALGAYGARDVAWVQEEPWNMGAWSFVSDRMSRVLPSRARLRYLGRREAASPATGSFKIHEQEEAEFVQAAFARTRQRRA